MGAKVTEWARAARHKRLVRLVERHEAPHVERQKTCSET